MNVMEMERNWAPYLIISWLSYLISDTSLLMSLVRFEQVFGLLINIYTLLHRFSIMRLSLKKAAKQYNVVCCCDESPSPRIPVRHHVTNTFTSEYF